ncbi:MAG: preprotein translocase subunit SecG [Chromatiales bacterium]|nr:preprotein translocase subunit SecG [Chromatiales bacterium]
MTTLHAAVLIVHVLIAAMIIVLVLIQRGKGAEQGAAFGAGASGTVFGARGSANFLSRTTAALATLFFVTSLSLAFLGSQRPASESLIDLIPTGDRPAVILPAQPAQDDDLPSIGDFGVPGDDPASGAD